MKGFSMVELMVAITIVAVITGGALVAAGRFGEGQKLASARDQLVSSLRMARTYARTAKVSDMSQFKYVEVEVGGEGVVKAQTNYGQILAERDVASPEIGLSQSPSGTFKFSPYVGKLLVLSGINWVPAGNGYNVTVRVFKKSNSADFLDVVINGSGLIDGR